MKILIELHKLLLRDILVLTAIALNVNLHINRGLHQFGILNLLFTLLLQLIGELADEATKPVEFGLDKLCLIRIFFLQFAHQGEECLIKVVYTIVELVESCLVIALCLD